MQTGILATHSPSTYTYLLPESGPYGLIIKDSVVNYPDSIVAKDTLHEK